MERRFVVTLEMYEWGETPRDAYLRASEKAKDMREKYDNECAVMRIFELSYGSLKPVEINAINLKEDK